MRLRLLLAAFCAGFVLCLVGGCGSTERGSMKVADPNMNAKELPPPGAPGGGGNAQKSGGAGSQ